MPPEKTQNLVEILVPMPDDSAKSRAASALERVQRLVITSPESYVAAAADLAAIKGQYKTVDKQREELKAPSLEGCRRVDAFFRPPLDFLRDAEKILKGKLNDYDAEQERLRREEQRRLDEEARKDRERKEAEAREIERKAREKAEAERRAAEAQRQAEERARREADQQRQAEERARREAEEAKRRGDAAAAAQATAAAETARREAAAAEQQASDSAAAAGKLDAKADRTESKAVEKSANLQAVAAQIVAPVLSREPPKVAGLQRREEWKFEIVDAAKIPREYLMVDETKIGKVVKALKSETVIAGIRVYSQPVIASGAA